jgi:hypothetical protein
MGGGVPFGACLAVQTGKPSPHLSCAVLRIC